MYDCFSPCGAHRVRTRIYMEACLYALIGYTVYDFTCVFRRSK